MYEFWCSLPVIPQLVFCVVNGQICIGHCLTLCVGHVERACHAVFGVGYSIPVLMASAGFRVRRNRLGALVGYRMVSW